jgi:hypothetical protein
MAILACTSFGSLSVQFLSVATGSALQVLHCVISMRVLDYTVKGI